MLLKRAELPPGFSEDELHGDAIHDALGKQSFERHQRAGLSNYVEDSDATNWTLRYKQPLDDDDDHGAQNVHRLDSAFSSVPKAGQSFTLHRGIKKNAHMLFGDVGSHVGEEFHDLGFTSSATEPKVARTHFSKPVGTYDPVGEYKEYPQQGGAHLVLHTHPNAKAISVPKSMPGLNNGEKEVLLNRGSRWRVASDHVTSFDPNNASTQLAYRVIHLHQLDPEQP